MPGEIALPTSEYPDDFIIINRGFNPGTEQYIPIFVPDRDMILDSWNVRYEVANGAALTGQLAKVADGVAMSTNTNLTAAAGVDFNTTANTKYTSAPIETANLVAAGNLVIMEFSAAPTNLGLVSVSMRFRSRRR